MAKVLRSYIVRFLSLFILIYIVFALNRVGISIFLAELLDNICFTDIQSKDLM